MSKETLIELAKDAPIPIVGGTFWLGVPWPELILVLTAVYGAWRLFDAVLTTYWKWRDRKAAKEADGSN